MNNENKSLKKETYVSPTIEVVEIEIEQSILASTSNNIDMIGEDW